MSGRAAPQEIAEFLTGARTEANRQRDAFREECAQDFSRFNSPIKRNFMNTFSIIKTSRMRPKSSRLTEIKDETDIFSRILFFF